MNYSLEKKIGWLEELSANQVILNLPANAASYGECSSIVNTASTKCVLSRSELASDFKIDNNTELLRSSVITTLLILLEKHFCASRYVVGNFSQISPDRLGFSPLFPVIDDAECFAELRSKVMQLEASCVAESVLLEEVGEWINGADDRAFPQFAFGVSLNDAQLKAAFDTCCSKKAGAGLAILFNLGFSETDVELELVYRSGATQEWFVESLVSHFKSLLKSIANAPSMKMSGQQYFSASEYKKVTEVWNQTATDIPTGLCVQEIVERQVEERPNAMALESPLQCLTYKQLNEKANQLAHYLVQRNITADTLVGVCIERSIDVFVAMLGILKAGGAYVPLDPAYPESRLTFMLEDSGVDLVVTTQQCLTELPFLKEIDTVCLDQPRVFSDIPVTNLSKESVGLSSGNLAYVIYTSGTTGKPKASLLEHKGLVNLALSQSAAFKVSPQSKVLQFASMSFDAATSEWAMALCSGASLNVLSNSIVHEPGSIDEFVLNNKITHATLPPALLPLLNRPCWESVTDLIVAGEACSISLAQNWAQGRHFYNAYGPSEVTVCASIAEFVAGQELLTIGKPMANTRCYVLNEKKQVLPVGVAGELYVGGVGVSRGYLGRKSLTDEKFINNPFTNSKAEKLYRTGDLVRWLPNGELEYIARIDEQIKIRGMRVEPKEIETLLLQHPDVNGALVIADKDAVGENRILAYVTPNSQDIKAVSQQNSVSQWQSVFDEGYSNLSVPDEQSIRDDFDGFNDFSGWNSSYTCGPIALESMENWRDATIDRILKYKPVNILEVGCGAGLLLSKLVGHCQSYVGTDLSSEVISRLQKTISKVPEYKNKVELYACGASELACIQERMFDTIVLNSVIQCFPDIEYLNTVLALLTEHLSPGGRIIIGDVRDYDLQEVFHSSIECFQNPEGFCDSQLAVRVSQRVAADKELVTSPGYFKLKSELLPGYGLVELKPKLGTAQNEMNRFRYDVVMHREERAQPQTEAELTTVDWQITGMGSLGDYVRSLKGDSGLQITNIPNPRINDEWSFWADLTANKLSPNKRIAQVKDYLCSEKHVALGEVDPSDWQEIAAKYDVSYDVSLDLNTGVGHYKVLLYSGEYTKALAKAFHKLALPKRKKHFNNPLIKTVQADLEGNLRTNLSQVLPAHMVPAFIKVIEEFPLTNNKKIDKGKLPKPEDDLGRGDFHGPDTPTEKLICEAWQAILNIPRVGIYDNFYSLGGDSLSAVRVINRIKEKLEGVDIFYAQLIDTKNVKSLAELLDVGRLQVGQAQKHSNDVSPDSAGGQAQQMETFRL